MISLTLVSNSYSNGLLVVAIKAKPQLVSLAMTTSLRLNHHNAAQWNQALTMPNPWHLCARIH